MSSDTGTRELADGRPGYRLVRREDVELTDALPGRSRGLTTCRLVGGALGSTHMALTLVSLAEGHVDEHLHSYESSFYVLEGSPAREKLASSDGLMLPRRARKLRKSRKLCKSRRSARNAC